MNKEVQTSMSFSPPHFSPGHAEHDHASRAPVQVDVHLKTPDGEVAKTIKTPFYGQTTLGAYDKNLRDD